MDGRDQTRRVNPGFARQRFDRVGFPKRLALFGGGAQLIGVPLANEARAIVNRAFIPDAPKLVVRLFQ